MRAIVRAMTIVAVLVGCLAAPTIVVPASAAAAGGTVTGTVTDAASGTPIGGIVVLLDGNNEGNGYNVCTASDGTYSIPNVVPDAYQVDFFADVNSNSGWGCAPQANDYI